MKASRPLDIAISIRMPGANNIEFGKAIDTKLKELKTMIPAGLSLDQVSNQPHIVKESIGDFSQSFIRSHRHRIARQLCIPRHPYGYRGGPYHSGRRVYYLRTDV